MIQKANGLDDTVRRVLEDNGEELLRIWNHHKYGDDLHRAWKESSALAELERLLARLEQHSQPGLKRKREKEDDGRTTASLQSTSSGRYTISPVFRITEIPDVDTEIVLGDSETTALPQRSILSPTRAPIPLPHSTPRLMDHYFKYTHCFFPILDRPYTLKKYFEYSRASNPLPPQSSDLAYIWAMCAYTKQQILRQGASSTGPEDATVAKMRTIARSLIPTESGPFFLGHVQALLLLTLLDLGNGKDSAAWILVGFAVRILLDRIDTTGDYRTRWTAALQGCFFLDTFLSMQLRKPPHLQTEYIMHTQSLHEDGHEEWEPWEVAVGDTLGPRPPAFVLSCFNRLTELSIFANSSLKSEFCHVPTESPSTQACSDIPRLQELAERYPFHIMQIEPRPPHQMLLQACHFAITALVSPLSATTRAVFKTKFLETLGLFELTWNTPERCGIPSVLTALFHLIHRLEPHDLVSDSLNRTVLSLMSIWPAFAPYAVHSDPQIVTQGTLGHADFTNDYEPEDVLRYTRAFASLSAVPPKHSMNYVPGGMVPIEVTQDGHSTKDIQYPDAALFDAPAESTLYTSSMTMDYGAMNIDVPQHNFNSVSMSDHNARKPATASHNFDGDEIDALFLEMAQLDITQWTMDRTQNLRDFGFADDSTFEAFCNDPDRLMLGEGYLVPASQNDHGVTYGTQTTFSADAGRQGSAHAPEQRTFDSYGDPW
ncbi:hypothetical protein A1O1_00148 [Capronia coronata CBS 617.96]|uniref:Xylanolytic transcriptional activator regulatory domain-containing protein n=1 Tax=Capronia coronata CBS 617.96 TaxID=1182541 RepID=W9YZC1_9EURO|nr:uncharacterized protein A1O1_00148 [Capronia coronata CBS 617.96]EXJ95030.1 hypothetical protein A1O1_00148 [Capronia coronata CBS 617.96]